MCDSCNSSRRDFLTSAGAAGLGLIAAQGSVAHAAEKAPAKPDPDAVLAKLIEGNKRFMAGTPSLLTRRRPEDFAKLAEGQAPKAIIVACADSRVAPELIFDQGIGDLFVVRAAGNIVSGAGPIIKGSLEFAVAELGARLILVLGHSKCGAVAAAIEHIEKEHKLPGSIGDLVKLIRPAVNASKGKKGDKLDNVIQANVAKCVETIQTLGDIIPTFVKNKEVKVVGGVYELKTGQVELLK